MKPKATPIPPYSVLPIGLVPQTGMPPIYHSRSKEIVYDALLHNPRFIFNPFGPQPLNVSRPEHCWQ
jgi:hypothetical protein